MATVPKMLISFGVLLIIVGVIWHFGGKLFPIGRLPGDIAIEKENFRFYFPLTTSLILSAALTIIMMIIRYFSK
jgi:hypothetical protein